MQTDDSINFLKNLARPETWAEASEQNLGWRPPQKPLENVEPLQDGLPEILSGDRFPKQYELQRRRPLVENFIRAGEVCLLSSGPKAGKTWLLQTLGICIAEGVPFLNMETAKGDILYLDLEVSQVDAIDRLHSISLAMGLKSPPKGFHLWSLRRYCYDLDVIIKTLHARLVSLPRLSAIIIEPLYMLAQSADFDENSSAACTNLLVELEKIALKNDCSLIMSHHFRKGTHGKENHIDRASGSGVFSRFPDCLVTLSPHQLPDHAIFEMTSRSQRSPEPFVIKMAPPFIELAENADPYAHRRYGERPEVETSDETVLALIQPGQSLTKPEWYAKARMDGVSQSDFEQYFTGLKSSGRVTAVDRDGETAYRLTIQ